jgi:hypothetical protein
MKKLVITFIILNFSVFGQFNPGAKQISLSNSDVALSNDVFSIFNNMSGLAQLNWREIGIYYSPAPFGLSELANGYVAYIEPTSYGAFSFGAMTYGFELYRESRFLFGYSNKFQKKFFYGLTINLHNVNIKNYGSDLAYYLNVGALTYLMSNLRFGFFVTNLNRATFSEEKEQIPTVLKSGLSYDFLDELTLNISIEKDLRFKPSFQFGIDYDLIEYLSLRSGFSNNPSNYSAGIGINYSMFNLDYAVFSHNDLGLTHQFGLIINFGSILSRKTAIRNYIGESD